MHTRHVLWPYPKGGAYRMQHGVLWTAVAVCHSFPMLFFTSLQRQVVHAAIQPCLCHFRDHEDLQQHSAMKDNSQFFQRDQMVSQGDNFWALNVPRASGKMCLSPPLMTPLLIKLRCSFKRTAFCQDRQKESKQKWLSDSRMLIQNPWECCQSTIFCIIGLNNWIETISWTKWGSG